MIGPCRRMVLAFATRTAWNRQSPAGGRLAAGTQPRISKFVASQRRHRERTNLVGQ